MYRLIGAILLSITVFLDAPTIALAGDNFFQIINDSGPTVDERFVSDRGYSLYVSYRGKRFLMDTGLKEKNLIRNLEAAGVLLDDLNFVLVSHRHYDHTAGVDYIRRNRPSLPVYIPPGGGFAPFGPESMIEVSDYLEISPDILLIHTHDETGSGGVKDELSLLIMTRKGPYLFTTNSHTDFFAKLEKAKRLVGRDIFFHSGHTARRISSEEKIMAHATKMKELNVRQVSPSHSNPRHNEIFKQVFGLGYQTALVGQRVPLEPPSE